MNLPEYELAVSRLERGDVPDYFGDEPSALLFAALFLSQEIRDRRWSVLVQSWADEVIQPWVDDLTDRCDRIVRRGSAQTEVEVIFR